MKFKEFMTALDGAIKNVYLLSGEETFFIDKAREKILARLNVDRETELVTFDCDTKPALGDLISAIDSSPFFGSKNVVLVKISSTPKRESNGSKIFLRTCNRQIT